MKSILFSCLCIFFFSTSVKGQLVNHFEQVEVILRNKKQVMPLSLPEGTTSYFYAITVLPKRKKRPAQESLYSQILRLIDDQSLDQIAHRISVSQKNECSVNVILVKGEANAKKMKAGDQFEYEEYFLNQSSGANYMSSGSMENVYIGIENRRIPKDYRVLVEVVAVIQ